jgi:signal transduction histidine kinase/ActR/RegA family two-component response regulator
MRRWFGRLPIHRKLVVIVLLVMGPALGLATIGLAGIDLWRYRQDTSTDTSALASVVAENTTAAVAFQDRADAERTLSALRVRPLIERACLYLPAGALFAEYDRTPDVSCPAGRPATTVWSSVWGSALVVRDRSLLGTVYVERQLGDLTSRLVVTALVDIVVLISVGLIAIGFANRLNRAVSEPIARLAAAARTIRADTVAPSLPQVETGVGEVDDLARALSDMLRRVGEATDQLRRREGEREDLLAREREASRLKDEFLAAVSHELRTPLSAIVGWAQVLTMTPIADERIAKGLASIERNARAQARLIEDLVDVSRIVTGKLTLRPGPVDLREVITAAAEAVRLSARARRLRVEVGLPETPALVLGDRDRLQQVFVNLLSNAVKFSPAEGQVSIALRMVDEAYDVVVRDSGVGIKPAFLPFVFDRFRQADGSLTREHGGLGLGLAIVKQITDLHGGSVAAASAGPGLGATFTVHLRRLAERAAPGPAPAAVPSRALAGVEILVVDDSPDAADVLATALTAVGAHTRIATSGQMGLAEWEREPADILLCDLAMPGLDGFEVLRRVLESDARAARPTRAIAISAHATGEYAARSLAAGFSRHVGKPYQVPELVRTISDVLAGAA